MQQTIFETKFFTFLYFRLLVSIVQVDFPKINSFSNWCFVTIVTWRKFREFCLIIFKTSCACGYYSSSLRSSSYLGCKGRVWIIFNDHFNWNIFHSRKPISMQFFMPNRVVSPSSNNVNLNISWHIVREILC